jgi:O-antigen ligase
MYDTKRSRFGRWLPVLCITTSAAVSVSRSAVLGLVVSMGVFIVAMRPAHRVKALAAIPIVVAIIFVSTNGLISTLTSFFLAGTSDPSIAHRVNNYPLVEQLVAQAPWFGRGGGTYIDTSQVYILDNQYLTTAVELGLVGAAALLFFLVWPAIAALVARNRTADPELRDLGAALAGAAVAGGLCSATFDSLSFPMFVNVQALILGLIGAMWLVVDSESKASQGLTSLSFDRDAEIRLSGLNRTGIDFVYETGGN